MQKTAQKRNILNKLKEMTNVSGKMAEKFFNPELKKVMDQLRKKDDQIRSIATGQSLGTGSPGNDTVSIKDLLKSAKSNLNKREYMIAVAELGRFHKKVSDIVLELKDFNLDVDEIHQKFLFHEDPKHMTPQHRDALDDLKNRFAAQRQLLIKRAGIMDFFYQFGTRGKELAFWEKQYPQKSAKLKDGAITILGSSENLLNQILSSLKEMANARATRQIGDYLNSAKNIIKSFEKYNSGFKDFYTGLIKPILEEREKYNQRRFKFEENKSPDLGSQVIPGTSSPSAGEYQSVPTALPTSDLFKGTQPNYLVNPVNSISPINEWKTVETPSANSSTTPVATNPVSPEVIDDRPTDPNLSTSVKPPETLIKNPMPKPGPRPPLRGKESKKADDGLADDFTISQAHKKFFSSLEVLSEESPILLSSFIKKYAQSIQTNDPGTAISLFKIVKSIRG